VSETTTAFHAAASTLPRPETRMRSYIVSQHRAGRPLSAIIDDPYLRRLGSESFIWHVIRDPRTLQALERDVREAIETARRRETLHTDCSCRR